MNAPALHIAQVQRSMADMTIGELRDVLLYSEDKLDRARAITWFEMRVQAECFQEAAGAVRRAVAS